MSTRPVAVTPMKQRAAGGLRQIAKQAKDAYPEMAVHQHFTDAARELDAGRYGSAQRHIHAGIFGMTPLQLRRHGVQDDAGHMRGKAFMQQAHRHLLLVKDIEDVAGSNDDLRQQRADDRERETQEKAMRTATAPPPQSPAGITKPTPGAEKRQQQQAPPPQPQQQIAASWEVVLHAVELAATPHHETSAGREALRKKGQTAYGKSFPVPNVSYLHKALRAVGRVAPGKRGVLKKFLQKRAAQLGVTSHLKGTWADPNPSPASLAIGLEDFSSIDLARKGGGGAGWMAAMHAARAKAHITASRTAHDTASRDAHLKMAKLHAKIAGSLKNASQAFGNAVQGSAVAQGEGAWKFANEAAVPPFAVTGARS